MNLVDDRILEYLQEHETGTATEMADSGLVLFSQPHISQRLGKLSEHGFVRPLGNGVYRLTDRGEAYLAGDYDARDLDDTGNQKAMA